MNTITKSQEAAMTFLSSRNPFDDIDHSSWIFILMEFVDSKGEEAIEGLAGAYLWAIQNKRGEECSRMIREIFAHDLNERKDPLSLPRSDSYRQIWLDEYTHTTKSE